MRKLLWLMALLPLAATADPVREDADMKLYLTSAAIHVLGELIPLLPFAVQDRTACYVTTAGNLEGSPPWMDDEINAVRQAGLSVRRVDLAALSTDTLPEAFANCDVIWVGGGNTYYLLQEVRRSGFDEFVVDRIRDGTPYVGTSAGSLILAPDLECIRVAEVHPDLDLPLDSYAGLNLFPLVPFVHFDNPDFKSIYQQILDDALEAGVAFVTVRENEFIYVNGEHWRIVSAD